MKKFRNAGATIIEMMIVLAIVGVISSVLIPQLNKLREQQILKSATIDIVSAIDKARAQSVSSLGPSEYGVHFDTVQNQVVIFKGTTYVPNAVDNEVIQIASPAAISSVSLTGGVTDLYFNRIFNVPNVTGTINLSLGSATKTITIGATGIIGTESGTTTYSLSVAVSANGNGTVTASGINCGVDCTESYPYGQVVTLTAVANSGYNFFGWSGGGCGGIATCDVTMTAGQNIVAIFTSSSVSYAMNVTVDTSTTYGTVTSNVSGIYCPTDCAETYAGNTPVTLTAVPNSGYDFLSWYGACTGTGTCSVTMDAVKNITAYFVPSSGAFPVVVGATSSVQSSPDNDVTAHTVSLPSGIRNGELLLVFFSVDGSLSTSPSFPAGWTKLMEDYTGAQFESFTIYYKVANNEGSTINVTTTNPERSAHQSFRIAGYKYGSVPEVSYALSDTVDGSQNHTANNPSSTPNSPSLSPTWGQKNTLWISAIGRERGSDVSNNAYPSSPYIYTNGTTIQSYTGAFGSTQSTARLNRATATEDPGAFTLSGTDDWIAATVAVQGIGGGGTPPSTYDLNLTLSGGGTGSVTSSPAGISCAGTCSYSFNTGQSVTLTASPSGGATTTWSEAGCSGNTCAVSMTSTKNITTTFTPPSYIVTPSAGANGTVSPGTPQSVASGSTTTFTTTPDANYTNGAVGGTCPAGSFVGNVYTTGVITGNCTVSFTFTVVTYTVTPSSGANGTVSPSTPQTVSSGTTTTFTTTPDSGYTNGAVGGTCPAGSFVGNVYTTGAITGNCTVSFTFTVVTYTVTPSSGANGSISPTGAQLVAGDGTVQFTTTPDANYTNGAVGGTCPVGSFVGNVYTTGNITSDCTVIFSFAVSTYNLGVTPAGTGSGTVTATNPVPPPGIQCGGTCNYAYNSGTSVTLSASASSGSIFTGWSGAGCSGNGTCSVTMDAVKNVTATFDLTPGTFPTVASSSSGSVSTDQRYHTVNMPSGIQAGDLLLLLMSFDGFPGFSASTLTGWTKLLENDAGSSRQFVYFKIADGSEGASTVIDVEFGGNMEQSAYQLLRITGHGNSVSDPPKIAFVSGTANASPNPPNLDLTATWGSGKHLWVSSVGKENGSNVTVSGYSTNYTPGAASYGGTGGSGASQAVAIRQFEAASENPSAFTLSAVDDWTVATIAVKTGYQAGGNYTLTTTKNGTGSGTIVSSPLGINCGGVCNFDFASGTSVTLTATPAGGSTISWSGAGCTGSGTTCVVSMSSAQNVTVTFTAPVSQISHVGSNSAGGATITIPAHQAGDLLVVFAYRDGSTTAPSLAAGWTNIGTAGGGGSGGSANSSRLAYMVATGSGTTSGTWTNATALAVEVYRGVNATTPIGANGNTGATSSTTVTYPTITLNQTNGTSWVAGFAGHQSVNTTLETAPAGMTNRTTFVNATAEVAGHGTTSGVSSWTNTNVSVGGTAGSWRARTLEIISQ